MKKKSDYSSNNCFIAANVIKLIKLIECMNFQSLHVDTIPVYAALCTYTTRFSHGFSANWGADMRFSAFQSIQKDFIRSACGPSGRDQRRSGRWMTSTMMSAVGLPPQPVSPHPEIKQMQLMHGCRCALGMGFWKRPHCFLTRDKSQQMSCFCLHHYLFYSSSSLDVALKNQSPASGTRLRWPSVSIYTHFFFISLECFISGELHIHLFMFSISKQPWEVQTEMGFFFFNEQPTCKCLRPVFTTVAVVPLSDTTFAIRFSHDRGDWMMGRGPVQTWWRRQTKQFHRGQRWAQILKGANVAVKYWGFC